MTTQYNDKHWAQLALSLMDLTSLNEDDTNQNITDLCAKSHSEFGTTAAVCIYPQFIGHALEQLNGVEGVDIATVTNFPHGNDDLSVAVNETQAAVDAGAHEVDVVFPYKALMAGNTQIGADIVKQCADICHAKNVLLKVIIETGELKTQELIKQASRICIENGADFIKTSTGKVPVNATLESAGIMLNVIKEMGSDYKVGFKAAGGVRSTADAKEYLQQAMDIMGEEWVCKRNFRFGASSLLASLLATLNDEQEQENTAAY